MFAGVSHLVRASQGVVDARLCIDVHFDYESLLLVNELASKTSMIVFTHSIVVFCHSWNVKFVTGHSRKGG